MKCLIHVNQMACCKTDLSDFFASFFFPPKVPEFLHVLFNLLVKHSPVFFLAEMLWLVPLCCIHRAHFDILSLFLSETKCKPAKNYRRMFYYSIEKHMQKFRHFWRKIKSLRSILSPSLQLLTSPLPCLFYILSARMAPSSSERENYERSPFYKHII